MYRKALLTIMLATAVGGCAVTPQPFSPETILSTARNDIEELQIPENRVTAPIGLVEAIARAIKFNREKKLKSLESALAQGQFELARYQMLPELTAAAGYSVRNNYDATASVTFEDGEPSPLGPNPSYSVSQDKQLTTYSAVFSWNILDFGLSYVRAKQHADRYLITEERERKITHNIIQDVRAAYWKAVSAARLLKRIGPLIEEAATALADSSKVEESQLRSPLEALYYQRELLEVLRILQSLRQDLVSADAELAALMGMKPGTPYSLADVDKPSFIVPELHTTMAKMEELALSQRPELVETYYQERISSEETRAALLALLPGISVNAGAFYEDNDYLLYQDWTSVGAQVSWNLLDIFRYGAERNMATTREALAREQRLATSMAVLTQVHLAHIYYLESIKTFTLADRYLDVSGRIEEQTGNMVKMQRSSDLELIRESLNALLAELRRDMAYAQLQNSYGRLFVTMGMDLLPEGYTEFDLADLARTIHERFARWQQGRLEVMVPTAKEQTQKKEVVSREPAI